MPKQIDGEVYNQLKVYQRTESIVIEAVSILVQKLEVNGSLMEACLGYDEELDLIQIVSSDNIEGVTGLVVMKLKDVLKCRNSRL